MLQGYAMSKYALIREEFCSRVLPSLAAARNPSGAAEWLTQEIVPILKLCAEQKDYQLKSVVLNALIALAPLEDLPPNLFSLDWLVDTAVKFSSEDPQNLRILAVRALGAASPR